jgi:hypothetical protein
MTAVALVPVWGLTSVPPPGLRVVRATVRARSGLAARSQAAGAASFLCSGPAPPPVPPAGSRAAAPEPLASLSHTSPPAPQRSTASPCASAAAAPAELHSGASLPRWSSGDAAAARSPESRCPPGASRPRVAGRPGARTRQGAVRGTGAKKCCSLGSPGRRREGVPWL